MFTCTSCNQETKHYAHGICKTCYNVWYRTQRDDEWRAKRATAERERRKRMGDEYRRKDRERNKLRQAERTAYNRAYYVRTIEQRRLYNRQYRKTKSHICDMAKRRYQLRKAQLIATLTVADWDAIKDGFDHRCVYCNRHSDRLTQEHIIPVSKGGAYTPENIVTACPSCNSRKHTKDAFEFLIKNAHARPQAVSAGP